MLLENEKLAVSVEFVDDLRTRQTEAFYAAHRKLAGENRFDISVFEWQAHLIRAALETKVVVSSNGDMSVDDLSPAATRWLAIQIDARIAEALTIPPE